MLARMETRHIGFLPLFVMDSNFAEDGETSRSTDRTISREVVDLTLDNCIARYWRCPFKGATRKTNIEI